MSAGIVDRRSGIAGVQQMDRFGIEKAMIGVGEDSAQLALKMFPDRFIPPARWSTPTM